MKTRFATLCATCFIIALLSIGLHKKTPKYRLLQTTNRQYLVEWSISLGGKEFLLESPFLKAGLEQSIKDFINIDIQCSDDVNADGSASVSFHSVTMNDIDTSDEVDNRGVRRIEGNGKCKGDVEKCKRTVSGTADGTADDTADDDDFFTVASKGKQMFQIKNNKNKNNKNNELCEEFEGSTIFDLFQKVLVTASSFNYNVDVGVIANLQGSLDLSYNVTFEAAAGGGLDQVDSVGMDVKDPVPINTECSESQCITQRSVIKSIFDHFGMVFDDSKHECLHQGLNCDSNDLVTHIWIGKKSLYLDDLSSVKHYDIYMC